VSWLLRVVILIGGLAVAIVVAWNGFAIIQDRPRSRAAELELRQVAKQYADPSGVLLISSWRVGSWLLGIFHFVIAIGVLVGCCVVAFG
jgi:hypothetical protein